MQQIIVQRCVVSVFFSVVCLVVCNMCQRSALFVVAGLFVLQRIGSTQEGKANFTLSGDYYNRELSGNDRTYLQH